MLGKRQFPEKSGGYSEKKEKRQAKPALGSLSRLKAQPTSLPTSLSATVAGSRRIPIEPAFEPYRLKGQADHGRVYNDPPFPEIPAAPG